MALPNSIRTPPRIMADDDINCSKVSLYPVNSSGNTSFMYENNNRIVFNIPAYPNSFVNGKRSFLSFKGKVVAAKDYSKGITYDLTTDRDSPSGARFANGVPVFQRMVIRTGSGAVVEDIDDYHVIERILNNFGDFQKSFTGMATRGDYTLDQASLAVYDKQQKGTVFHKPLLSGLLGPDQSMYIPVGLFESSGGYAFQIELSLTDPIQAVKETGAEAAYSENSQGVYTDCTYVLDQVRLNLELVKLPERAMGQFNRSIMDGDQISVPFKTMRLHKNYIPALSDSVDVNLSESAHNVSRIYTVLRPQVFNKLKGDLPGALRTDNLDFIGGTKYTKSNVNNTNITVNAGEYKVKTWQFKYGQNHYPADRVDNTHGEDTNPTLLHSLSTTDMLDKPCVCLSRCAGKGDEEPLWEQGMFCIVQGFDTFKDPNVLAGLNSSSTGAPIQLYLDVDKPSTDKQNLQIESFVQSDFSLNIKRGGITSILDGDVTY